MTISKEYLTKCLGELQLITCSLLPGEIMEFIDDAATWEKLLEDPAGSVESTKELSPPHFTLSVEGYPVVLDIEMQLQSNGLSEKISMSHISVKGNIKRDEHSRWLEIIRAKETEVQDAEFPTFELISLYLLPLLHEEHGRFIFESEINEPEKKFSPSQAKLRYHALLTSHHIRSPHKIRSMKNWSSSLSIVGFLKVGYPGVIYGEGTKENIEEFVDNIKNMQWLALRVRFLEPLPEEVAARRPVVPGERIWNEFQKVGEVVEEMRRIGREEYVVEMGIGSAGHDVSG